VRARHGDRFEHLGYSDRADGWLDQKLGPSSGHALMNPAPLKDTVEVIKSVNTSDDTVNSALKLLERMGKRGLVVADSAGFVSTEC